MTRRQKIPTGQEPQAEGTTTSLETPSETHMLKMGQTTHSGGATDTGRLQVPGGASSSSSSGKLSRAAVQLSSSASSAVAPSSGLSWPSSSSAPPAAGTGFQVPATSQASGSGSTAGMAQGGEAGYPPPSEEDILREAKRRKDEVAAQDSPDTDAEDGAWAAGSGWRGLGPPLKIPDKRGTPRPFWDGGGLCSPGKWPPGSRNLPDGRVRKLGDFLFEQLAKCNPKSIYRQAIAQKLL